MGKFQPYERAGTFDGLWLSRILTTLVLFFDTLILVTGIDLGFVNYEGLLTINNGEWIPTLKNYMRYMKALSVIGLLWSASALLSRFKLGKQFPHVWLIMATFTHSFFSLFLALFDPNLVFFISDFLLYWGGEIFLGLIGVFTIIYGRLIIMFPSVAKLVRGTEKKKKGFKPYGEHRNRGTSFEGLWLSRILSVVILALDFLIALFGIDFNLGFIRFTFPGLYSMNNTNIFETVIDFLRYMKVVSFMAILWSVSATASKWIKTVPRIHHSWITMVALVHAIVSICFAFNNPEDIFIVSDTIMNTIGTDVMLTLGTFTVFYGRLLTLFPSLLKLSR